jgi:hypothetical protein
MVMNNSLCAVEVSRVGMESGARSLVRCAQTEFGPSHSGTKFVGDWLVEEIRQLADTSSQNRYPDMYRRLGLKRDPL